MFIHYSLFGAMGSVFIYILFQRNDFKKNSLITHYWFFLMTTGFYGLMLKDPFISSLVSLSTPIFTMIFAVAFINERFYPRHDISLILLISEAWLLS